MDPLPSKSNTEHDTDFQENNGNLKAMTHGERK